MACDFGGGQFVGVADGEDMFHLAIRDRDGEHHVQASFGVDQQCRRAVERAEFHPHIGELRGGAG
ncbi:Uncharacterised protein [Mycobacteroides abscessus subsp. abscessus]|nr:Uncharacterised protein [Mycobacteroides abscessus subsp. abscessus]